jgi:hypothetical protein
MLTTFLGIGTQFVQGAMAGLPNTHMLHPRAMSTAKVPALVT